MLFYAVTTPHSCLTLQSNVASTHWVVQDDVILLTDQCVNKMRWVLIN